MALDLNNVMLGSSDSTKLADFYTEILGKPNPDWSDPANGWFGWQVGSGSIAVGPHSEVSGQNPQPGRIMINFTTSDVDGEFERIKGLGARVVAEPYDPMGGSGMRMCTFADPEGNYFQLTPPWQPS